MGWIVTAPSGSHKASYRNHERKVRSKSFKRKSDAERWLRGVEVDLDRGDYVDPRLGRATFGEFFEEFIRGASHLRPKSIESYRTLARCHLMPRFGNRPVARITTLEIESWLGDSRRGGTSAGTAAAAFRVLRLVLSAAERGGVIGRNPARGVRAPTGPKREMRFLTAEQVGAVADAVPDRYRALVLFLAYSGVRIGEASALRVENVDLLRGRVQIVEAVSEVGGRLILGPTKSGRARAVALPSFLVRELGLHLAAFPPVSGHVFTTERGGSIRHTNFIKSVWYPALRETDLEPPLPRVHDLRHTSVALAIAAGAHPKEIQSRLGHASITLTLDTYGHLFPGLDERLAERLDALAVSTGLPATKNVFAQTAR